MSTNDPKPSQQPHQGSFASGQEDRDLDPEDREVGTFAEGEANPDLYPKDREVGTFAEGEAQPDEYAGEDHEERSRKATPLPSIDHSRPASFA
jgi:hypothetical protein